MNITLILSILLIHWFLDFVLQTDKQAKGKSTSWECLLNHTVLYSFAWFMISIVYASSIYMNGKPNLMVLLFAPITFICHTATDYYTSRVNKILWDKEDAHGFFVSVGFDQYLHYIQLFLTYKYLTNG